MHQLKIKSLFSSKKRSAIVLFVCAVVVFGGIKILHKNKPVPVQTGDVITYSTDKPDEKPPGSNYKWLGGPNDPKKISMPTINKVGFVQKVGVDQKKAIAVPGNVHIAGWFNQSVLPGQPGLSIIDGHVDGYTSRGIFYDLKNLKKDDQFSIEFGDGHNKEFKVVDVQSVPKAQAAAGLFSQDPKVKNQLNLITCGGVFDKHQKEYLNRIIVIAESIS